MNWVCVLPLRNYGKLLLKGGESPGAFCLEGLPLLLGVKTPLAWSQQNINNSSSSQTQQLWADMASVCVADDGVRKAYCSGSQPLGWESLSRGAGDRWIDLFIIVPQVLCELIKIWKRVIEWNLQWREARTSKGREDALFLTVISIPRRMYFAKFWSILPTWNGVCLMR